MSPTLPAKFIGGHRFSGSNGNGTDLVFEIDWKTIDLNAFVLGVSAGKRVRGDFIRIGVWNENSPLMIEMQRHCDGRMCTDPPRINGLYPRQRSFNTLIWKYYVDNGLEGEGVEEMNDDSSDDDDESTVSSSPPAVSQPPQPLVTPVKTCTTPVHYDTASRYPHLSQALGDEDGHFDPADPSVKASLRGLLQEINELLSTKYELNVSAIASNKPISYVRVPRTRSDNAFTNSKEWLDTAIKISGSQHGGTFESAYRISNHLIKFYKDSFLAACHTQGVPVIKPMTATEFQSMLNAGKVTGTGERELKKHLHAQLGRGFCPTRRSVNMLSEGHAKVEYGSCNFTYDGKGKSEFIEWTE
jgi:hypothetical protein